MIKFRLEQLEKSMADLAKFQAKTAADMHSLIGEQAKLTKALRGIAGFQYEVRQMHTTHARLFSRVDRIEAAVNRVRDDFNVYTAREDGKNAVYSWIADHWSVILSVVGGAILGTYLWITQKAGG